jgi:hypothetical protein
VSKDYKPFTDIGIITHTGVCLEMNTHTKTLDYFINDKHVKDCVVSEFDILFVTYFYLFKDAFSGKNNNEIINKIKYIVISGSYPKLEELEKFPSKEFNFSPLIHKLLNTSKQNIIKKFQYPNLQLIYKNIRFGIKENRIYLFIKII